MPAVVTRLGLPLWASLCAFSRLVHHVTNVTPKMARRALSQLPHRTAAVLSRSGDDESEGGRRGELFIQEGSQERERELILITEVYYIVIGLSLTA